MNPMVDAFWRAAAYCVRPKVILLSFLPLILMLVSVALLGNYFSLAVEMVRGVLESTEVLRQVWAWTVRMGLGPAQTVMAHLLVIFTVTPLIVVLSLLLVTLLMAPVMVKMVARRRFPDLQVAGDAGFLQSLLWSLAASALALLAMVVTLPLWLIPPLMLVLPPLIWGWLTYRIMAFDALATHASTEERRQLMQEHRLRLLGMGLFCGYLGGGARTDLDIRPGDCHGVSHSGVGDGVDLYAGLCIRIAMVRTLLPGGAQCVTQPSARATGG